MSFIFFFTHTSPPEIFTLSLHDALPIYVGECTVTIVLVKNAASVGCDENIRPSVVVVVADGNAHSEGSARHTGFFGDISECAVAIVFVKCIADRLCWGPEIARPAVHQVDIHPSVVVKVEESATWPQRLRKVAIVRHGILVDPLDTTRCGGSFAKQRLFG